MMENQNTFDMTENIPDEMFEIIGLEKDEEVPARPRIGYWADAWRRFKENKVALLAGIILLVLIFFIIFGPAISGYGYEKIDSGAINQGPSAAHWFGTDDLGRDLFARVWQAGRVSLLIGITGALVASLIGSIYGGIAAYFGGIVDDIMMRIVEVLLSIPYLPRKDRASANLQMKIIMKHMIPNTLGMIIVAITFDIPGYIFSEAFLSYVGLGIQPPQTSWGALASAAQQNFMFYPTQLLFPAIMIALTMLSFTLLGDGLRDALDPKLRK